MECILRIVTSDKSTIDSVHWMTQHTTHKPIPLTRIIWPTNAGSLTRLYQEACLLGMRLGKCKILHRNHQPFAMAPRGETL